MAVIGIDLGTTNSLGCVYRNGKAELIPNAYGSYLTPSVVSMMEDGRLVVGQPAKDRLIAEHFLLEHGVARQQLRAQEYAVLLKQAERCKKLLSEQDEVVMHATVGDQLYESTYTMDRLFEESKALLKEIRQVIGRALKDGKMTIHDVDLVVMAGGSSKMPLIQKYIRHLFHQAPMVQRNCDELIALGLGLVCGVKERKEEIKGYILTDICPFTLGTGVNNEADPKHPYMSAIIERNSILPCSKIRGFSTAADYQSEVKIEILQGEEPYAEDNVQLGVVTVAVPKKKKGMESVDVRFTYDINGILEVEVTVVSTGKSVKKVLSQNMDEKEIAKRMKQLEKLKVHPKDMTENQLILERLQAHLEEGKSARGFDFTEDELSWIHDMPLLSAKPVIYAANMSEEDFRNGVDKNEHYQEVKAIAEAEHAAVLPICAKIEEDIADMEADDKAMFLEDLGLEESGLNRIIREGYSLLGLISYLTAGKQEVRAWTITKGTKAPQAAGKIHTDFEKGFIRAEVVSYDDLMACGSMAAAKEKGLVRLEGKDYVMQDGDIVLFRFNV